MPSPISSARALYNKMRKEGLKELYHATQKPQKLMDEGIDYKHLIGQEAEDYKPHGLYWGPNVKDLGSLVRGNDVPTSSLFGRAFKSDMQSWELPSSRNKYGVIRGLVDPKARITTVTDKKLEGLEDKALTKAWKRAGLPEGGSFKTSDPGYYETRERWGRERTRAIEDRKRALDRVLGRTTDILEIQDVDGVKGLTELIQIHPGFVHSFWKDKYKLLGGLPLAVSEGEKER